MPQRAPRAQPPPPPIVEAEKPKNDGDLIIEGSGLEIEIKKCLKFLTWLKAVKLLCDTAPSYHHHHRPVTDEQKLKNCGLLLRRAPATRKAVLGTISKCIEKHVKRLPDFKKNLDDMRQTQYNSKGDDQEGLLYFWF